MTQTCPYQVGNCFKNMLKFQLFQTLSASKLISNKNDKPIASDPNYAHININSIIMPDAGTKPPVYHSQTGHQSGSSNPPTPPPVQRFHFRQHMASRLRALPILHALRGGVLRQHPLRARKPRRETQDLECLLGERWETRWLGECPTLAGSLPSPTECLHWMEFFKPKGARRSTKIRHSTGGTEGLSVLVVQHPVEPQRIASEMGDVAPEFSGQNLEVEMNIWGP